MNTLKDDSEPPHTNGASPLPSFSSPEDETDPTLLVGLLADLAQATAESAASGANDDGSIPLAFTRGTTFDVLDRALAAGALHPHECKVFQGDKLIYLFYGRFAYRVNMPVNVNSLSNDGPVALVFRSSIASSITMSRIFPFDSGGYEPHYKEHLGQRPIAEYLIRDLALANKVIQFFWSTKNGYFWFNAKKLRDPNTILEVHRYLRMYLGVLQGKAVMEGDDRRGSFEVSVAHSLALNAQTLAGIVIPKKFVAHRKILELKKDGVIVKTYNHFGERAEEHFGVLRERVFSILKDAKYLEDDGDE